MNPFNVETASATAIETLAAFDVLQAPLAEGALTVTLFRNYAATKKRERTFTLRALRDEVLRPTASEKEALPWLKLATFGDNVTENGSLRHDANMLRIFGVEADYDGEEVSVDDAIERLSRHQVHAMVYTSPSHTPEKPRFRVLCPLSVDLPPEQREGLLDRLNGVMGGILARESWTRSQSYYYGSVNRNPAHRAEIVQGDYLDLRDDLPVLGKPLTKKKGSTKPALALVETAAMPERQTQRPPLALEDVSELVNQITTAEDFHGSMLTLIGHWATKGTPRRQVATQLNIAFAAVAKEKQDERWKARRDDAERCIDDIFAARKREAAERRVEKEKAWSEREDGSAAAIIHLTPGRLHVMTDQIEAALIEQGAELYQRGSTLVRPVIMDLPATQGRMTKSGGLVEMKAPGLMDLYSKAAVWIKTKAKGEQHPVDPPGDVAAIHLSRVGKWRLPSIAGVVTTPTLRPDGSVLMEPGHDAATRLFLIKDPSLDMGEMIAEPTQMDAEFALIFLSDLIKEFPFVEGGVSRAVALSALITPVVRGAMSVAPAHAIKATTAGTGKSYLVDIASAIATGRPCPVMSAAPDDSETDKRLTGMLLAAAPIISIDNVNGELGSDLLCQATERAIVKLRRLGSSDVFDIESRSTIFATGNGLRVRGDMVRRTLLCSLDANCERPELRAFASNPVQKVMENRARYVAACLTIVRAYRNEGSPGRLPRLASFETWSDTVRSALVWLGEADPVASMEEAREADPELAQLRELLILWREAFGAEALTIRDLAVRSAEHHPLTNELRWPDLREVILRVANERGVVNTKAFGRWMLTNEGRIVDGLKVMRQRQDSKGIMRWGVVKG